MARSARKKKRIAKPDGIYDIWAIVEGVRTKVHKGVRGWRNVKKIQRQKKMPGFCAKRVGSVSNEVKTKSLPDAVDLPDSYMVDNPTMKAIGTMVERRGMSWQDVASFMEMKNMGNFHAEQIRKMYRSWLAERLSV